MKIEGARVLVTGASRGIGRAAVLELARQGARLAIAARDKEQLGRVSSEVEAESGVAAVVIPADMSKEAEVRAMVAGAETELDGIDVLVNNAGLGLRAPVDEIEPDDMRYVFEVNVMAALIATRAALPGMLNRGRGQIVNVGSVASHISTPTMGGYSATKFALKALSDALRMELQGRGVGVSLICPGPIATDFSGNSRGDIEGRFARRPVGPPAADVGRCIARAITRNQAEAFVPAYYQALVGADSVAPQIMRVAGRRGYAAATKFADRFL